MVSGNIAERLPWDSTFFGMSIQRMTADGSLTAATLRRETCDADCTYVFCAPDDFAAVSNAVYANGGCHFGTRVVYHAHSPFRLPSLSMAGNVVRVTQLTDDMISLAQRAGIRSRFYRDPLFAAQAPALYERWIRRDFEIGGVFVSLADDATVQGVVTVSNSEGLLKIGLAAVRNDCTRRGIGRALLCGAIGHFSSSHPVEACEVVTQGDNVAARHLYARLGFVETSVMHVFHVRGRQADGDI